MARSARIQPPAVLVIAGHDSSGGAGVDADRQALEAHGARALVVVTAWTSQAGGRVRSVGARSPGDWLAEASALVRQDPPAVIKCGLLPGADHVRAAAGLLGELGLPAVVDPVLAASGGEPFLDGDGVEALLGELLPLGVLLTPNLPEAARLCRLPAEELAAARELREQAARTLLEAGAGAVVLKGGHGREDPVEDLFMEPGGRPQWTSHPRIEGASLHGSGCRHASALAAGLARGLGALDAARVAGSWVGALMAHHAGAAADIQPRPDLPQGAADITS